MTTLESLGAMVALAALTDRYKEMTIADVSRCFIPACVLNQVYILHDSDSIYGFATWTYLPQELIDDINRGYHLQVQEWNSGDNLFFVDFICPNGRVFEMVRGLRRLFPNERVSWVRQKSYGRRPAMVKNIVMEKSDGL